MLKYCDELTLFHLPKHQYLLDLDIYLFFFNIVIYRNFRKSDSTINIKIQKLILIYMYQVCIK